MNAKNEFINHVGNSNILCCSIEFGDDEDSDDYIIGLTTGWTKDEFDLLMEKLNREYDPGYGCQILFGTIWYTDGTWSDRFEYDGSENWQYNKCPDIPSILNRIDKVRDSKLSKIL